jgi:hypothetical protein
MGGAESKLTEWPPVNSVIVAPLSGDSGDIRRHPRYKDQLRAYVYEDVQTCYQAFQ